jgi:hypothetical protein
MEILGFGTPCVLMSRVLESSISRSPKCRFAEMDLLVVSPLGYTLSPYDLPSYDRSLLLGSSTQSTWCSALKTPKKLISEIPKHFVSRLSPPYAISGFPTLKCLALLVFRIPEMANSSIPKYLPPVLHLSEFQSSIPENL